MIYLSIIVSVVFYTNTIRSDDCKYSTNDGILDLRTLGYKDRPKYSDIPDTGFKTLSYSFNGCFAYSTKDSCQNAAACMTDSVSKTDRLIARQANRKVSYNSGVMTIGYTDGVSTALSVFLICKTTESIQATKIDDNSFMINIESECACPGKCTYSPDSTSGQLTGGAIFVIVLLCVMMTYLVISVLFLRFVKHEQGMNLIPNRTLWLQIGHDSIRGIRFVLTKVTKRNTYEKF